MEDKKEYKTLRKSVEEKQRHRAMFAEMMDKPVQITMGGFWMLVRQIQQVEHELSSFLPPERMERLRTLEAKMEKIYYSHIHNEIAELREDLGYDRYDGDRRNEGAAQEDAAENPA